MADFPPFLKKGDTIGLVAPAGFTPIERMQTCIETLDGWGYNLKMGATTHSSSNNYFSGTDRERLDDLQQMLDDPEVKAILCARGGYGMSRIIDDLNFKKFKKRPKWIIGFSDITVLQAHLLSKYKIGSLHAPMAGAFADAGEEDVYVQSLKNVMEGGPSLYKCPPHPANVNGTAKGTLVGGNLSLLAHLIGTESEMQTKNKILFLEDVSEYLYNIDRMLIQLKRAGALRKLTALIVGGFTELKDTERPFGETVERIILHHVKDYGYPVCFNFPVSHERENFALKIGGRYQLKIDDTQTILTG